MRGSSVVSKGGRFGKNRIRPLSSLVVMLVVCLFFSIGVPQVGFSGTDRKAKKAYEEGDFDTSVRILIEKLRKKPKHQDNIRLMETVLPLAFQKHITEAEEAEARNDWDKSYDEYFEAKKLADEIALLPAVLKERKVGGKKVKEELKFKAPDVRAEVEEARTNAMEWHYQKGLELEQESNFKDAAIEFRSIKKYDSNYQDAPARYEECRKKATLRIAVMPFENLSGKGQFGAIGQILATQVISNAMNSSPEFLEFVTRDYVEQILREQQTGETEIIDQTSAPRLGKILGIHAFVFGKILNVITSYPPLAEQKGEGCREVYGYKSKYTACAQWTKYSREGSAEVSANFQVIDVERGTIILAETAKDGRHSFISWVTFRGDEAALPKEVRKCNASHDTPVDPPEVLVNRTLESLSTTLSNKLIAAFE